MIEEVKKNLGQEERLEEKHITGVRIGQQGGKKEKYATFHN